MNNQKILILGSKGMVGSAIIRKLNAKGFKNTFGVDLHDADLREQNEVRKIFGDIKPDIVLIAAAKVGGIHANNTLRAEFIYDNLMIAANAVHSSYKAAVSKLIFLGSSCIYPKNAPQPLKEEYLLGSKLEYTNEPYAIAKIAGVKLCESYFKQYGCNYYSLMPTNLYGPNDNFNLTTSHVLPALLRKFHEGKQLNLPEVKLWGSGTPRREFLYVGDLAEAVIYFMNNVEADEVYKKSISHINIGSGKDISISALAELIKDITGYKGKIEYDKTMPDGTARKLLDVTRANKLGWFYKTELKDGITRSYEWFLKHHSTNIVQSTENIVVGSES